MDEEDALKAIDNAIGRCMIDRDGYRELNDQLEHTNAILLDVVDRVRKASRQRGGEVAAQAVSTIIYDYDHGQHEHGMHTNPNLRMRPVDQCRELRAEIKALRGIILVDGQEIGKLRRENKVLEDGVAVAAKNNVKAMNLVRDRGDEIKRLESSESGTVGKLRDINTLLHKTVQSQDDIICSMTTEIDDRDKKIVAKNGAMSIANNVIISLETKLADRGWGYNDQRIIHECQARNITLEAELKMSHANNATLCKEREETNTNLYNAHHRNQDVERKLAASERANEITEQAIKSAERALIEKDNLISELEKKDRHLRWLDDVSEYVIKSMTGLANDNQMKIDELETKLADRERQFDVLDGALDKTRGLLHVAENYIREQNVRIAELESDRDNESDKRRRIVDRWDFHVGDKVTSTNCAKQSEGIDISGVVVEIDRGILYVYVTDDGVRLVNKVWMKKV